MSFVIFGDIFSFPDGKAATNRIYTYAKGFGRRGIQPHVICFANNYMDNHEGEVEGIKYYHPFAQKTRSRNFFVRRWLNLKKYLRTYRILKQINRNDKIIAINAWTYNFQAHLLIWLFCKLLRTKLIFECNEHPLRYYQQNFFRKKWGKIRFFIESRLYDGTFCISRYLVNFHIRNGINQKKLLIVPSTVDPSRFDKVMDSEKPFSNHYIGYFGSLTFKRDNVDMLVKSFALLHEKLPDHRLVLGGFCLPDEKNELIKLIKARQIEDRVNILEYLSRDEILRYVYHADVLVLVRSNDLDSAASYPSKLTEFLATGKPVVTVNVGEVSDFMITGENGFVVNPGDEVQLYEILRYIFNNYDRAVLVGKKGRELTSGIFNYDFQAGRMVDFIRNLHSGSSPDNNSKKNSGKRERVESMASKFSPVE